MKLLFLCLCFYVTILAVSSNQPLKVKGGYSTIAVDDEVQKLALFSLDSVSQQSGSKKPLGLSKVVSAKSQVVNGKNYKLKLLACEKVLDSTNEKKNVLDEKSCRSCDVTIWDQPLLDKKSVTDVSCSEPSALASFSNVAEN